MQFLIAATTAIAPVAQTQALQIVLAFAYVIVGGLFFAAAIMMRASSRKERDIELARKRALRRSSVPEWIG